MVKKIFILLLFIGPLCYAQNGFEGNRYALSQAYMQGGQYEKALPIIQQLYNSNPSNYQYFLALNEVFVQLKNYDASIVLLQSRIKTDSLNINLYGMLGTTYYLKGNENKAFSIWDNALKKLPQSDINYRVIANYAAERRAFDKAIDYLQKGQNISKNPVLFAYDLANLYTLTMQFANATEEYCLILSQNPTQLQYIQNKILEYMNKPDAVSKSIPVLEKYSQGPRTDFKMILARLYAENKDYDKAFELYKKIDDIRNSKGTYLFHFAEMLYDENKLSTASKVFNDIIDNYPESPIIANVRLGYAKTLEGMLHSADSVNSPGWKPYYMPAKANISEADKVINAYSDLTKSYPNTEVAQEAYLRIAEIEFYYLDDANNAEKYFQEIVKKSPYSKYAPSAYMDLAKIEILKGNLAGAESYYNSIKSNKTYSVSSKNAADYRLARIFFFKGDFNKAKEKLGVILEDLKDNTANDALELSLLMNTSQGDSSNLVTFASAELLAEQRKYAEAEEKYKSVISDPQKLMLQNLAMFRQAEMELALNNYDTAVAQLKKISDENEKNIYADKALYLLGEIYQFGLKNNKKAIEIYQNLLAKFPNSLYLDEARAQIIKLQDKLS